jgi:FixJ family two-component response regulator
MRAGSAAEALANWKNCGCKVRLLITDLVMPGGLDGSLLAERLLCLQPELKIIYTSGHRSEIVAHGNRLTEGINFLSKPFTEEHLLETVRNALIAGTADLASLRV